MDSPTPRDYVDAAKIIGSCKTDRLIAVLDLLKQGGIELSEGIYLKTQPSPNSNFVSYATSSEEMRKRRYEGRWTETDDPIIIALRNAYIKGIKIATIASAANLTRTVLYEYMVGRRQYSPYIAERFIHAFHELNIPFPPESDSE